MNQKLKTAVSNFILTAKRNSLCVQKHQQFPS